MSRACIVDDHVEAFLFKNECIATFQILKHWAVIENTHNWIYQRPGHVGNYDFWIYIFCSCHTDAQLYLGQEVGNCYLIVWGCYKFSNRNYIFFVIIMTHYRIKKRFRLPINLSVYWSCGIKKPDRVNFHDFEPLKYIIKLVKYFKLVCSKRK